MNKEIAKQFRLLYCNGFTPLQLSGLRLGRVKNKMSKEKIKWE